MSMEEQGGYDDPQAGYESRVSADVRASLAWTGIVTLAHPADYREPSYARVPQPEEIPVAVVPPQS